MKRLSPRLRCAIAVSAIITAYAIGVATAGWSPHWVSATEARSTNSGHRGGGFCPSDKRLIEIFQAELQSPVERVERHAVNSCEYGWAMIRVTVVRSTQTNTCLTLLHYDPQAKQWYVRDLNWIGSSGGDEMEV